MSEDFVSRLLNPSLSARLQYYKLSVLAVNNVEANCSSEKVQPNMSMFVKFSYYVNVISLNHNVVIVDVLCSSYVHYYV